MANMFPTNSAILEALVNGRLNVVVEDVLDCLVGEALRSVTRSVDMVELGFGDDVLPTPITYKGSDPQRAAFVELHNRKPMTHIRLHVQRPFRLDSPSGPYVGGHDIYYGALEPHVRIEGRWWDTRGSNLFDVRIEQLVERLETASMVVRGVVADRGGGFIISIEDGWSVHVLPVSTRMREHWRLFYADGKPTAEHFVVFQEEMLPEPSTTSLR